MSGPRLGDAFGTMLRAALAAHNRSGLRPTIAGRIPVEVIEVLERDDGLISAGPAARYLAPLESWSSCEQHALDKIDGSTLDIGVGAGRVALELQQRGVPVTGLDISPGAVEVSRARGLREAVCATVDDHARSGQRYDTFLLYGHNLGLLESMDRAPVLLAALAAMARPGARLIAHGADPYATVDPLHLAYHKNNRILGRMSGQLRLRVRYLDLASAWFDYLVCSPLELEELVRRTDWRLSDVDVNDAPAYMATLTLSR